MLNLKERERLISVSWGRVQEVYPINIQIDAWDRLGLLRDITTLVAEEKVNISGITLEEHGDNISIFATLEISGMSQLTHLLSKIRSVRGVTSAIRSSHATVSINS